MPEINKGESLKEYLAKCVPYCMKNEGLDRKAATGKCAGMWKQHQKTGKNYTDEEYRIILEASKEPLKQEYSLKDFRDAIISAKYEPPEAGKLPKEGKDILRNAYASCRKNNPEYPKERCSKIAWGAVKNAGWKEDKDGKWTKSSVDELPQIQEYKEGEYYPFIFNEIAITGTSTETKPKNDCECASCNSQTNENKFEPCKFIESASSEKGYSVTIAVGGRFMRGVYLSNNELKRVANGFHNTMHDLNHMGSGYQLGFSIVPSNVAYIVGYQDNPKFDDTTGELKADLHIEKDSPKYNDWKNYINISSKIGRIPNVSMFVYGRIKYVSTKDLPNVDFKSEGYNENDLIPCMTDVIPYMVSTVFKGVCDDKKGCGIKHNQSNNNVNIKNENEKVK